MKMVDNNTKLPIHNPILKMICLQCTSISADRFGRDVARSRRIKFRYNQISIFPLFPSLLSFPIFPSTRPSSYFPQFPVFPQDN